MELNMYDLKSIEALFLTQARYTINDENEIVTISLKNMITIHADIKKQTLSFEDEESSYLKEALLNNKDFVIYTAKIYLRGFNYAALIYC